MKFLFKIILALMLCGFLFSQKTFADQQLTVLNGVEDMSWRPDGDALAWGEVAGDVHIWIPKTRRHSVWKGVWHGNRWRSLISSLAWSPNGRYLAVSRPDLIDICEISPTGQVKYLRSLPHDRDAYVAWHPRESRIASASASVKIWNINSSRSLRTIAGVSASAWSPDGKYLATGINNGTAVIWQVNPFKAIKRIGGRSENTAAEVIYMAWNPAGTQLLTQSYNRVAQVWDVWDARTGRRIIRLANWGFGRWSKDGKRLIGFDDKGDFGYWSTQLGKPLRVWKLPQYSNAALHPNEHLLAVEESEGRNISLWNIRTGKKILTIAARTPR